MSDTYDVIVIGAGMIGASCAAELAAHKLKVMVLDASQASCGATGSCMGHILLMDDSDAQLQLTLYSKKLWLDLVKAYPVESDYLACGTLWVATDDEEMTVVNTKAKNYADYGVITEVLDSKTLYQWEPNLRPGLVGGLRIPDDCVVYAAGCVQLLLRDIEVRQQYRVKEICDHAVVLEDGSILKADIIINAAGVASPKLTPGLPVEPRKGHLVVTERYPNFCTHQIVELGYIKSAGKMNKESVAFNIQPRLSGQYLIGSSRELVGFNDEVNRSLVSRMVQKACEFMPGLADLMAIRVWAGFRPATPDKLPLIGKWPTVEGLYIATGHEGLGIATSQGTAALLAAEIVGKVPEIDPAPYRAERVLEKQDA